MIEAVCIWGEKYPVSSQIQKTCEIYNLSPSNVFFSKDIDIWRSLWLVNQEKKQQEINTDRIYQSVAYVNLNKIADISEVIENILEKNTVYYLNGSHTWAGGTEIDPYVFYCDSMAGDIVSNFIWNRRYEYNIERDFYHHIKTYKLKTRCLGNIIKEYE